jgi:sporulation protein YlmC with PRC-barrel domain
MLTRKSILTMTTAAALCAAPVLAFGQANTGGSSMQQGTTQTTPQQGPLGGSPAARGAATTGSDTGRAPNAADAQRPGTANRQDGTPGNPPSTATQRAVDAVTGNRTDADGTGNNPPGTAAGRALDRAGNAASGAANSAADAVRPGQPSRTDGTPGNPPSTATQRAADAVTGNRTDADGTGNNPPGTALGRALGTSPSTGNAPGNAATGAAATGAATGGMMAVDSARLRDGRRASQVIGSTIYNENNESIGEVEDLIVPSAGGQPVAILSVGGFLGIGARLVAVPYERLQHNAERNRWMLQGATKDSLQSLPAYQHENTNRRG